MSFELKIAWRHLRSGGSQTILTIAAVAIAVTVIIFINSLITGVQQRIIFDVIGSVPHITVKAPDRDPQLLADAVQRGQGKNEDNSTLHTSFRERMAQQRTDLDEAEKLEAQLAKFPGVKAVVSAVRGQAFVLRGQKRFGVTVTGADPVKQERISNLQRNIIAGRWIGLGPEDVVIGFKLGEEAGLKLGDRLRVTSSEGVSRVLTVAGIFDSGQSQTDLGQIYVTLRTAQMLFNTQRSVSSIQLKLDEAFQADNVSALISNSLKLKTESWMQELSFFVNGIRAQNGSRLMISAFALLASVFSIASVLIVSVLRKSRQIGILKSMGARDRQILLVFTLEGLGVSVLGAVLGGLLGAAMLAALMNVKQAVRNGKIDQLFPVVFDPMVFAVAMGSAVVATVLAALMPARRAARMDPVEVIRGG